MSWTFVDVGNVVVHVEAGLSAPYPDFGPLKLLAVALRPLLYWHSVYQFSDYRQSIQAEIFRRRPGQSRAAVPRPRPVA
jgi:hypothetical protein